VASCKVEVKKSALKDLEKLDKHYISKIFQKIESLSENPRPVQSLKLKGSRDSYRLRVGDFRIIYQIDDPTKTVTVFGIGHRKEVYRKV